MRRSEPIPERLIGFTHTAFQTYTQLQRHFLTRLFRLEAMRKDLEQWAPADSESMKVLNYGTYAAWLDCVDQDVEREASEIVGIPAKPTGIAEPNMIARPNNITKLPVKKKSVKKAVAKAKPKVKAKAKLKAKAKPLAEIKPMPKRAPKPMRGPARKAA